MIRGAARGGLAATLAFALLSLLAYHLGPAMILFLLPIQVAAARGGPPGLVAAPIMLLLLAAIRATRLFVGPLETADLLARGLELAMVALLLAGLVVANTPRAGRRGLTRLLAGAGIVAAGGAALISVMAPSQAFDALARELFSEVSLRLRTLLSAGGDSVAGAVLEPLLAPDQLRAIVGEYFLRSFAFDGLAILAFSWWAGRALAARLPGYSGAPPARFADFRLEGRWLWPLIASLALVGAELAAAGRVSLAPKWRIVAYAAWNAALTMLFLYALQGLAIIRFWFERRGWPRLGWLAALAAFAALLASPRANILALALPLFGASEHWIRYRVRREGPNEKGVTR